MMIKGNKKDTTDDSSIRNKKIKTLTELHKNIMKLIKDDRSHNFNNEQIKHDLFTHINMSQLGNKQLGYLTMACQSGVNFKTEINELKNGKDSSDVIKDLKNGSLDSKASASKDGFGIRKIQSSSSASDTTKQSSNDSVASSLKATSVKFKSSLSSSSVNLDENGFAKPKSSPKNPATTNRNIQDRAKSSVSTLDIDKQNDKINHKILSKTFSHKTNKNENKHLLQHNKATKEIRKKRTMARKYHVKPQDLIDTRGNGLQKLDGLIGLTEIKHEVKDYIMYALVAQRAKAKGMNLEKQSLNMIFKGSPGTGKTMVARLVGKILYQNHVIQKPLLHEISAKDLISGIVGGSSKAANKAVKQSVGGILFVDEAHVLAPQNDGFGGNEDSSKKSALSELMRETENYRGRIVVILAGYKQAMDRLIANGDEGMRSRFSHVIMFPNYTNQQMIDILKYHARKQSFKIDSLNDKDIRKEIIDSINFAKDQKDNSNGRFMRNLLQNIVTAHFCQLGVNNYKHIDDLSFSQLQNITKSDMMTGISKTNEQEENSNKE